MTLGSLLLFGAVPIGSGCRHGNSTGCKAAANEQGRLQPLLSALRRRRCRKRNEATEAGGPAPEEDNLPELIEQMVQETVEQILIATAGQDEEMSDLIPSKEMSSSAPNPPPNSPSCVTVKNGSSFDFDKGCQQLDTETEDEGAEGDVSDLGEDMDKGCGGSGRAQQPREELGNMSKVGESELEDGSIETDDEQPERQVRRKRGRVLSFSGAAPNMRRVPHKKSKAAQDKDDDDDDIQDSSDDVTSTSKPADLTVDKPDGRDIKHHIRCDVNLKAAIKREVAALTTTHSATCMHPAANNWHKIGAELRHLAAKYAANKLVGGPTPLGGSSTSGGTVRKAISQKKSGQKNPRTVSRFNGRGFEITAGVASIVVNIVLWKVLRDFLK